MKIPPKRVPSDDCVVHIGRVIEDDKIVSNGTPYNIHEGEWVDVIPVLTMRQYIEVNKLATALPEANPKDLEAALNKICHDVANRLVAWNWTGMKKEKLPPPSEEVLRDLTEEELLYLVTVCQGESPGERKNDSTPLVKSSSGAKGKPRKG